MFGESSFTDRTFWTILLMPGCKNSAFEDAVKQIERKKFKSSENFGELNLNIFKVFFFLIIIYLTNC